MEAERDIRIQHEVYYKAGGEEKGLDLEEWRENGDVQLVYLLPWLEQLWVPRYCVLELGVVIK